MASILHLLFALQATQAAVVGTVRDAGTGEPLAAAVVALTDLDRTVVTDRLGAYVLHGVPTGPQHLSVQLLGYASRTLHALVPPAGTLEINVLLQPEPIPLAALPVRPTVALRGVEDDGADIYPERSLSLAALRNHPLLAEPDAFQALGGGEVIVLPESPSGIHVRGGSADQTAYTIDGIPVFNPYHAAGLFSAWNPDALAAVRLSSAIPSFALPDALSGVVTGVTRAPGRHFGMQGSITTTQSRATVDGPITSRGGYLLSVRSSYPGIIAPGDEASYLDGESGDALAKLETRVFGGALRFIGYQSENEINAAVVPETDEVQVGRRHAFEWQSRSLGMRWLRGNGHRSIEVQAWRATTATDARWRLANEQPASVAGARRDEGLLITAGRRTATTTTSAGVRAVRSKTSYHIAADSGGRFWSARGSTPLAIGFIEHARALTDRYQASVMASVAAVVGELYPGVAAQLRWSPTALLSVSGSIARQHQFTQSVRNGESIVGNIFPADLHLGAGVAGVPVASSTQAIGAAELRPTPGVRIAVQAYARRSSGLLLVGASESEPFATTALTTGSGSSRGLAIDLAKSARRYGMTASYGMQHTRLEHDRTSYTPVFAVAHALEAGLIVFPTATSAVRLGATGLFGRRTSAITGTFEWESCNLLDRGCEFAGTPRHDPATTGRLQLPAYLRVDVGLRKHWHLEIGRRSAAIALFGTITNVFGRGNVLNYSLDPLTGQQLAVEMRPRAPLVIGLDWRY